MGKKCKQKLHCLNPLHWARRMAMWYKESLSQANSFQQEEPKILLSKLPCWIDPWVNLNKTREEAMIIYRKKIKPM
jgi:hypothetical protein